MALTDRKSAMVKAVSPKVLRLLSAHRWCTGDSLSLSLSLSLSPFLLHHEHNYIRAEQVLISIVVTDIVITIIISNIFVVITIM